MPRFRYPMTNLRHAFAGVKDLVDEIGYSKDKIRERLRTQVDRVDPNRKAMARDVGLDYKTMLRHIQEAGVLEAETLAKVGAYLGLNAEYLLYGRGEPHEPPPSLERLVYRVVVRVVAVASDPTRSTPAVQNLLEHVLQSLPQGTAEDPGP